MAKRKGMGKAKGSQFERDICRQLSIWWSNDSDVDDLFWRTSMSGGRATIRGRQGKTTRAHCGDICSVDDKGKSLTDRITFEVKRGYSTFTVHDLLDTPTTNPTPGWEKFIIQADASAILAKTRFWTLLHKRNRRQCTMTIPEQLWKELNLAHVLEGPNLRTHVNIGGSYSCIRVFLFQDFLDSVTPAHVKRLRK